VLFNIAQHPCSSELWHNIQSTGAICRQIQTHRHRINVKQRRDRKHPFVRPRGQQGFALGDVYSDSRMGEVNTLGHPRGAAGILQRRQHIRLYSGGCR
jgi:hypothetical protein